MSTKATIDQQSRQEAELAVQANLSPRWRRLDRLEAYAVGRQYAGLPHWLWPQDHDTPMAQRGPHVVDSVVADAIGSYKDLLLGEGRWPTIKVQTCDAEDSEGDDDAERIKLPAAWNESLSFRECERECVEKFIDRIVEHAKLTKAGNDALVAAMSCGTVVTTVGARKGQLVAENLLAKWCTPTWSKDDPLELESLEVRYPYTEQYWDEPERKWKTKALLYRRVIDRQYDRAFEPTDARKDATDPTWTQKPLGKGSVEHGYGFVPAVWWAFDRRISPMSERDGHAIHAEQLDKIDALCRGCSQHDRAALYCGDPQIVESGVDPNENPTAPAQRAPGIMSFPGEDPKLKPAMQSWGMGGPGGGDSVRRKGPGVVWRYSNANVKVEMLQLGKDGIGAIASNRDDLRSSIADALGWVRDREPGSPGGGIRFSGLSGEALKWMYQKQLSRCDSYRPDFADGWLLPIVHLCLRVVLHHATTAGAGALYLAGASEMAAILKRFATQVEGQEASQWFSPPLLVSWPAYFQPTDADKATVAKDARENLDAGLITTKTAVVRIEPFFDDIPANNVEEYVEQLEEAKDKRAKAFGAAMAAMGPEEGGDDDETVRAAASERGGPGAQRGDSGKPEANPPRPAFGNQAAQTSRA